MSLLRNPAENIPAHIFRAYDIRGIVTTELTTDVVYDIGLAIGSEIQKQGDHRAVVGRDGRLSGPGHLAALIEGIMRTGCHVVNIGMVSTPVLYFATHHLKIANGIMLTGSHNPVDYNGLKMIIGGKTLTDKQITGLYQCLMAGDVISGEGKVVEQDIIANYIQAVKTHTDVKPGIKVVIDAGNGATGHIAPKLFAALGCDVTAIFCDVDGHFPNHHPDPSQPENLIDIIAKVKSTHADVGFAFDGDGDRLGLITSQGEIIYPDRQLMLFAQAVLQQHPGEKILFDVKSSKNLFDVITQAGGIPMMYKTGHSLLKNKMLAENSPLAGEMSGHLFFNDKWFGFDDAMYSAARMLEIMSQQNRDLDTIFAEIPNSVATPEIQVAISEAEKFSYMETLQKNVDFDDAKVIDIDGLRIEFADGWGLIRPSNTTANLTLRFEADNTAALQRIQMQFKAFMLAHKADLDINLPV